MTKSELTWDIVDQIFYRKNKSNDEFDSLLKEHIECDLLHEERDESHHGSVNYDRDAEEAGFRRGE